LEEKVNRENKNVKATASLLGVLFAGLLLAGCAQTAVVVPQARALSMIKDVPPMRLSDQAASNTLGLTYLSIACWSDPCAAALSRE
jgi:hypothetical protein